MTSVLHGLRDFPCRSRARPWAGRRQQGFDMQIGDSDEREVAEPLDTEVPRPPLRRELAAEDEQAFELEEPVAGAQHRARDRRVTSTGVREQIGEDAEVE